MPRRSCSHASRDLQPALVHPNKRLVPETVDHDPVQPPDAPHVQNRGVVGYRGFRPSQRERVGKTYSKWLTGSNEGTALSAEEQSAEQQLRASGDFGHASSHSKRVFRAKKDDRRAKAFTADELEADYRVALDQVGGQAGVERLIRNWSGKVAQQFQPHSNRRKVQFH